MLPLLLQNLIQELEEDTPTLKFENESSGEEWRYGTFQVDVQADGRR